MKRNAKKKSEPKGEEPDASRRNRFINTDDDQVIVRKATDEEMAASKKIDERAKRKPE